MIDNPEPTFSSGVSPLHIRRYVRGGLSEVSAGHMTLSDVGNFGCIPTCMSGDVTFQGVHASCR